MYSRTNTVVLQTRKDYKQSIPRLVRRALHCLINAINKCCLHDKPGGYCREAEVVECKCKTATIQCIIFILHFPFAVEYNYLDLLSHFLFLIKISSIISAILLAGIV